MTENMSVNENIEQSVKIGSPFIGLSMKLFSEIELLEWLALNEFDRNNQIAYKAMCGRMHPDKHYLSDGNHFLTKKPEYAVIAIGYNLNYDIPDSKNPQIKMEPIIAHICKVLELSGENTENNKFSKLLLTGKGDSSYISDNLSFCYKARLFPLITNGNTNKLLIEADWTEPVVYNEQLVQLVVDRLEYLKDNAPKYYSKVIEKYRRVVENIKKKKLLTTVNKDYLYKLNLIYPGTVNDDVFLYDDMCYKISLFTNDVAGYVLGFPVYEMLPSDEQIKQALLLLSSLGQDAYISMLKEKTKNIKSSTLPTQCNVKISNYKDVIMEDIENYLPFDVVTYQEGEYIYRFTRPEFENILSKNKNPWTNEKLPVSILATIKSRLLTAKSLNLPPCVPVCDMFDKIKNNTFIIEDNNNETLNVYPVSISNSTTNVNDDMDDVDRYVMALLRVILSSDSNDLYPLFGQDEELINSVTYEYQYPVDEVEDDDITSEDEEYY